MRPHTTHFLEQMEAKRLQRPCNRIIDMRGKVPGECQRYEYGGRVFWLDDISHAIFKRGLERSSGVFTLGIYEAIVNGPHTNRAIREAEEARRATENPGRREEPESQEERRHHPQLVTFGYYKHRKEERIEFATRLEITADGATFTGTTRNISVHGVMAYLRGLYHFEAGQVVNLSFPEMAEKASKEIRLSSIRYRIMQIDQSGTFCALRMRLERDAAPASFTDFIQRFILAYRRRNKLDVDDDVHAAAGRVHERHMVENMVSLPLFVAHSGKGLYTRAVGVSLGNAHISRFFHVDGPRYDLLPLSLSPRLERLRQQGEMVVALYRDDEGSSARIFSADDSEFDDPDEFLRFVGYALHQRRHLILRLVAGCQPVRLPNNSRYERTAGLLGPKWHEASEMIQVDHRDLIYCGSALDFTEVLRNIIERTTDYLQYPPSPAGLLAWCGRKRVELQSGVVHETLSPEQAVEPSISDFSVLRQRREVRYRTGVPIEIKLERHKLQAVGRDISLHGLRVATQQQVTADIGDTIHVGFPSLQEKRPKLNLMRIPYRIVRLIRGSETQLMLVRLSEGSPSGIDEFFEELIETNRGKLAALEIDLAEVASACAWEGVVVENTATIPFFFGRREEDGLQIRSIGLPFEPCSPLAEFFRTGDEGYDFTPVTTPQVTLTLRERFMPMQREANVLRRRPDPISMEVYIYKEMDAESGRVQFRSADDRTLATRQQRVQFIQRALEHGDYRFIHITATSLRPIEEALRDELLHSIHLRAEYEALQLDNLFLSLEGYGEMVDITEEVTSIYRGED